MFIDRLQDLTSSRLAVVNHEASVQEAALFLSRPGIGLVVVCDGSGIAAGVLSKSDLVRHLTGASPSDASVIALMSRTVVSCTPRDELHDVWQIMAARKLQNVPVLDTASRPIGVLDIRDAMKTLFDQEQMQEQMLFNYVAGIGYR